MKRENLAKRVAVWVLVMCMVLVAIPENSLAATPVKLTRQSVTLKISSDGESITYGTAGIKLETVAEITVTKIKYKAMDDSIVNVTSKGIVTARKAGKTRVAVTVKYRQNNRLHTKKLKYKVTVKKKITSTQSQATSSVARTSQPPATSPARTSRPTASSGMGTSTPMESGVVGTSAPMASDEVSTNTPVVTAEPTPTPVVYKGSNVEAQNYQYGLWSSTIKSYLISLENGCFMRLQGDAVEDGYLVEYYDSSYQLTDTTVVPRELSLFGGFYATEDYYFILTGQENRDESDDVEVYRITKYDKKWNRLSFCGLYGANTYIPFDAGSARMITDGDYLLIRTCHEMYQSSDGNHHQANVTIQVDMENMTIVDSYTGVMNTSYGYVSHSFNQFIQVEDGKIVAVDHGDAYPRSIVLTKYATAVDEKGFVPDYYHQCTVTNLLSFEGSVGENYTGASVGGFQISDTAYLVAGSQDIEYGYATKGRNIFIASQSKTDNAVTVNTITDYETGTGTTDTPQFVSIAANRYLLLWHRDDTVYYTEIDGDGNQTGEISSLKGDLSDCVPIVAGDKLVWYTWNNADVTFYEIALDVDGLHF